MDIQSSYFDCFPRIVPADRDVRISITPRFPHSMFPEKNKIALRLIPMEGQYYDHTFPVEPETRAFEKCTWDFDGHSVTVCFRAIAEQEYVIRLILTADSGATKTLDFHVHSLYEDLFHLRPLRGDFHIHTYRSDGRESPEYVPARYRELGFDFMAISDHHRYAPSLEAINFWKQLPVDMRIFPGEEVHATGNPVHVVNFGGNYSVNDIFKADDAKYRREVQAIADSYGNDFTPGLDRFPVAATEWVFDRIREAGGVAIFAHPYWEIPRYAINEAITDEIFKRRKFDAFELLGGFHRSQWRSNNYQIARYYSEVAAGNDFPVVGLSDSHGTDRDELFGWYSTVVMAASDNFADIAAAIRASHSTAVQTIENAVPFVAGPMRMVRLVSFLLEHYFPRHDELCRYEGLLMREFLRTGGDINSPFAAALQTLGGQVAKYREKCFAPCEK